MTNSKQLLAALFASLMMVSMVGAAVAPAAAQTAGPEGMVALGNAQVSEDLPAGSDAPIRESDLEGAVYASNHADTLEVIVTTPERADQYLENGSVVSDDDVAIVLRDQEVHEGRDVAIDAGVLEDALGYQPSVAYGVHDSGEEWQSEISTEGSNAIWNVPHFSSNSVTFTGGIELTGDAAGDGTSYEYELDSLDGVDNYAINLTGVANRQMSNDVSVIQSDGTQSITVGGNAPPEDANLTLTGVGGNYTQYQSADTTDQRLVQYGDSGAIVNSGEITFENPPQNIKKIHFPNISATNGAFLSIDVYAVTNEGADGTTGEGTLVKSGYTPDINGGSMTIDVSDVNTGGDKVTFEFVPTSGASTADGSYLTFNTDSHSGASTFSYDGATSSEYADAVAVGSVPKSVSVETNGGSVSFGDFNSGQTKTKSVPLSLSDSSINFTSPTVGELESNLSYTEVTETTDPVVEVNGYETTYEGTLADGETTSLATNTAWLQNGTNNVTVSTASPATGPESLVGLEYAHDAAGTTRSVDVEATSWTEKFNVSHTYPSATADANAVLTFDDRVAEIDSVEYRVDGGEWTSPPTYELNGTDLEVGFGDVAADTTIDVRATGYKIKTYDGSIDILEPTVEGDDLATKVEITDKTGGTALFGIRVDGTALGDRVHYATSESWSGDPAHVSVTSSGTQILRAEDANVGSTMTIRSAPISVSPESGAVEVVVEDGTEPRFSIRQGNTTGSESVEVGYYDTLDGERYVLWSETQGREIDADRAESPVFFTTDDTAETYTIRQLTREGSVGGGVPPGTGSGSSAPLILVLPAVGLSVAGLFFAGRRFGGATGVRGNAILLVGSTIVSAAALELVTPTSLLAQIYTATVFALGDAVAGGLGAVVAAIATLVGLWQLQQRTRADVPVWVTIPSVTVVSILALESIRPGSVLGALEGVIAEVGALLALILVGFGIYWWRRRNKVKQTEASTPDTQVTLDLGSDGNGDD